MRARPDVLALIPRLNFLELQQLNFLMPLTLSESMTMGRGHGQLLLSKGGYNGKRCFFGIGYGDAFLGKFCIPGHIHGV